MKKIFFLFLLFPFASFCQCATWIGQPVENSLQLIQAANADLVRTGDTARHDAFIFSDDSGSFKARISMENENVKMIYVQGPVDKIDSFYNTYILPKIESCKKTISATLDEWNGIKLVHSKQGMKTGFIEIEKI